MKDSNKYAFLIFELSKNTELGKKMVQKLLYLMERKGLKLDLNYSIHFFGPYSAELDNILHSLEIQDIIKIDTSGKTHKISMHEFEQKNEIFNCDEKEMIDFVINHFGKKTALELEALTTLDYVANYILRDSVEDDQIIKGVVKIKNNKFTSEYLLKELNVLKKYGYLS